MRRFGWRDAADAGAVCDLLSEPLGGVRNLQVLNPTMTTLNVRWEPAEGRVKEYKVVYAPAAGGPEMVVGPGGPRPPLSLLALSCCSQRVASC